MVTKVLILGNHDKVPDHLKMLFQSYYSDQEY